MLVMSRGGGGGAEEWSVNDTRGGLRGKKKGGEIGNNIVCFSLVSPEDDPSEI